MQSSFDEEAIVNVGKILRDNTRPLAERFRALFTLRNIGGKTAISNIAACFDDSSALLKHECAYCLGQMQDSTAIPLLIEVLKDINQDVMVRHEAGEALGAIGSSEVLELLQKYCNDPSVEVAETCQLAVERIKWLKNEDVKSDTTKSPYASVDPAPPFTGSTAKELRDVLLDESKPLFTRYRAMFALRNIGDVASLLALTEGLKCKSALFRHEIAYVLGQIQHEAAVEYLQQNLSDVKENYMVRHECAEALGSIATDESMELLEKYLSDKERVVRESCEVALDMCEYERSGQLQYADCLSQIANKETCISYD